MDKQNAYIHSVGYYSVTKRTEVLTYASTWVDLVNKPAERRQMQKACVSPSV